MGKRSVLGGVASGVICCATMPVFGVDAAHADQASPTQVQEIIVTAEKRETVLERTPVAITAYDADQLESRNITGVLALQYFSPGLFFGNLGATSQLSIRGVGANYFGGSPSVAVHIDGIFQGRDIAATFPFFDVDRVEVLNGPQGTLYGRNTTAGAINLILVRPTPELSVDADASYGNYNSMQFRARISGPITTDQKLTALASFTTTKNDGYMLNIFDGHRQDFTNNNTGRLAFDWKPNSTTEVYLSGTIFKGDDDSYSSKVLIWPAFYSLIDPAIVNPASPWQVNEDVDPKVVISNYAGTLEIKKTLGPVQLVSLSGYLEMDALNAEDADQSPLPLENLVFNTLLTRQFTQEFRISNANSGPFDWIAGLYWFHEHARSGLDLTATGLGLPLPFIENFYEHTDSYAGFAEGSYEIAKGLRLTAGVRGTTENINGADFENTFGAPSQGTFDKTWSALTWKVGADYQVNGDNLLYGSVSRGFKSGGFNVGSPGDASFGPEYNLAFEVGSKSLFLHRMLQLNLAAFYYDYTDLQVFDINGLTMASTVKNAAKATIYGAEVSLVATPTSHLEIDASAAPLHARYGQFLDDSLNLQGNYLDRAPNLTFHVGAQYVFGLRQYGTLTPRVDYSWSSPVYFSEFNFPTQLAKTSHRTDLNLRWTSPSRQGYFVEGYVLNVENDAVIKNILVANSAVNSWAGSAVTYAPPRLYGVRIGLKF